MKLASIISLFDGEELLVGSMRSVKDSVDLFIIVHQSISNHGELYDPLKNLPDSMDDEFNIVWIPYEPNVDGMKDETRKRNIGINVARNHKCSHFLFMDVDEYYLPGEFQKAKQLYIESEDTGHDGSVVGLYTYFKSPCLRQENPDNYYVPFIHELKPGTTTGLPNVYPYYVDPTRRIRCEMAKLIPGIFMQHYSWVRHDIQRKARNSSAKFRILQSNLLKEYETATDGSFVDGGKKLIRVPDYFGINEMLDTFVQKNITV